MRNEQGGAVSTVQPAKMGNMVKIEEASSLVSSKRGILK